MQESLYSTQNNTLTGNKVVAEPNDKIENNQKKDTDGEKSH